MAWRPPRPRPSEPTLVAVGRGAGQAGRVRDHLGLREGRTRPDRRSPRASRRFAGTSGFPIWLRFLTASFVIVASIAGGHLGEPDPLPVGHRQRAQATASIARACEPFLTTPGSGPQTILILGSDKRNQEISGKYGPLRHDDAAAARSGPRRDRPALAAARPEGRHPGRRDRQAQRRLLARRPEADARRRSSSSPGLADQPPRQRRLHRLRPGRQRDRLRLRRRRPPLLPPERPYARASEDYAEINLQPGYQALCGFDALAFVRYRHTDNDIVRAARQQAFLREARAKVPPVEADRGPQEAGQDLHHTTRPRTSTPPSRCCRCCGCSSTCAARRSRRSTSTARSARLTSPPRPRRSTRPSTSSSASRARPARPARARSRASRSTPEQAPDATKPKPALRSKQSRLSDVERP